VKKKTKSCLCKNAVILFIIEKLVLEIIIKHFVTFRTIFIDDTFADDTFANDTLDFEGESQCMNDCPSLNILTYILPPSPIFHHHDRVSDHRGDHIWSYQ
jgi:hypothetical protein